MLIDLEKKAIQEHYRLLTSHLAGFRSRHAQKLMLAEIAKVLANTLDQDSNTDKIKREGESILVVEGPTGVGKSLAYLLSGTIMAAKRNKKLIISSATIALQEQLILRDLPFIAEYSGLSMTYALAKGRGRYLCPYRLYQITQANSQGELLGFDRLHLMKSKVDEQERVLFHRLADAFAERQFNGDKDTWQEPIAEITWSKINNDRHGCLKNNCPNKVECPFFLARETLEKVDIIVVNHDLLLSDISMGGGVILPSPEQSFYCIDEAHHLSKKAIKQFSAEHSLSEAKTTLEKVSLVLDNIAAITDKAHLASLANEAIDYLLENFNEWEMILNQLDCFPMTSLGESSIWLWEIGRIPEELKEQVKNTDLSLQTLMKPVYALEEAINQAKRDQSQNSQEIDKLILDLGFYISKLEQIQAVWCLMQEEKAEQEFPLAKWITLNRQDKADYYFSASPVSGAVQLANQLWSRTAGAVLTSATLRSLGNFDLLLKQTGLNFFPKTTTLALESPFDFTQQAELYIPPLQFSPKMPDMHTTEVVEYLPKLIDITSATGTLVLFSSRKQMQDVANRMPENIIPLLLIQGDLSKGKLIQKHIDTIAAGQASIIFGLDSFAEGLDLPGLLCIHVIIAKLPFSMPDSPIDKTLSDWINQRGGNPFIEITVPETSVKLLQAVGRLIRTETDFGRVTILDNRILSASYGRRLLSCLPTMKRI